MLDLEKNNFGFENPEILIIQKFYDNISQNFVSKQQITTKQITMNDPHMKGPLESKSEVKDNKIWGVLDVDSEHLNHFNEIDKIELEKFCQSISTFL